MLPSMNDEAGIVRVSAKEVARLVGVTTETVKRWSREGRHGFPIGVPLPGAGWVFRLEEVLEWVREREEAVRQAESARRQARGEVSA